MNENTSKLHALWKKAIKTYEQGNFNAATYFTEDDIAFLHSIGMNAQEMYDFAEDWVNYQEPDFETMRLLQSVREDYFKKEMKGQASDKTINVTDLPSKTEILAGILWLPRIIPKAKAKLRGEMPPELMYCCGGDRRFFKENNIHPAEFLQAVAHYWENENALIHWVQARRKKNSGFLNRLKKLLS